MIRSLGEEVGISRPSITFPPPLRFFFTNLDFLRRSSGTVHNTAPEFNPNGYMNTAHSVMMAPSMYSSSHIPFGAHSKLKHCLGPAVLSEQRLSKVHRYKQKRQARSALKKRILLSLEASAFSYETRVSETCKHVLKSMNTDGQLNHIAD